MEAVSLGALAKLIAEQGILGLGWVMFIWSIRIHKQQQKQYADLVTYALEFITKVAILRGNESNVTIPSRPSSRTDGE